MASSDIAARRAESGANVLTPPPRTPGWKLYLEKFDDPIIRILLIAAGIAIAVGALDGQFAEGIGIVLAILLATFLAYWNEARAAREFDVLNETSDDLPVKAIRDGGYVRIPKRDLVRGDRVFVEVGEEVPADGTIDDAVGLLANEARLTGEAAPVEKAAGAALSRGTTIVDGSGHFTVNAVGDRTEIGRTLRESLAESDIETPLNRQLARLSRIIGVVGFSIALVAFAALFVRGLSTRAIHFSGGEWVTAAALALGVSIALVNIWLPILYDAFELLGSSLKPPSWLGGRSWPISIALGIALGVAIFLAAGQPLDLADARQLLRNFMIAVTIIVVAVPEGLAMSVTLSLAYSMRKMTASHTLVRHLEACETIGAATIICSDKTGTLTRNEMRVASTHFTPGPPETLWQAMAANSTAQLSESEAIGNPTEAALLLWLREQGGDYAKLRDVFTMTKQWSFSTERKLMATLGRVLHVKGAPEIVLGLCTRIRSETGERPLNDEDRQVLEAILLTAQSRGMRTLAFAVNPEPVGEELESLAHDLVWLGLAAIADPVRPEVPDAVAACRAAGVQVKIVTGDNAETAREIARQIGVDDAAPLTGPEFAALSDVDAKERAGSLAILARARPADKLRLVRLLRARGEVVAVTGDGVNDGPALHAADVGLAMGRSGTAVAREASDIILLDDSFASIVGAIRWGRALYENIQRFILFQLTINVAALGLAVLGPFIGYELPLTVMQMLWVNLIMDTFAALALATEPPHADVLTRPPRSPRAFIVTPPMAWEIFSVGGLFLAILAGFIAWNADALPEGDAPSRAGTRLFTLFVLLQFWNLFNAKAFGRGGSVFPTLGNNPSFTVIAAAIFVGQVLLVQFGGEAFRTVPLSLVDWLILTGMTSLVLVAGEIRRALR